MYRTILSSLAGLVRLGMQYLIVVAGAHDSTSTKAGGSTIAYALPKSG